MNRLTKIDTSTYSIFIGNVFEELENFLRKNYPNRKIYILVDENTEANCLPLLDVAGVRSISEAEILLIDSGEEFKNIEIVNQLWESLLELGAERSSVLLNLGGGVIGDMGGFVASTFKRGMDFIQIPTTLLSMVDASIGGKLGIDLLGQKNMVGLFNEPASVFAHPDFLKTLDHRELLSGFAEVLKHALIFDSAYWQQLSEINNFENVDWKPIIERSVTIKKEIVEQDFKESGLRKVLNFGHTVGHAIESLYLASENSLKHGEAVIAGMIAELYLSRLKFPDLPYNELSQVLIQHYDLPLISEKYFPVLIDLMKKDKKNSNDNIECVYISEIGMATYGNIINEDDICDALLFLNKIIDENN